jgi:hypothetical protein
MEPVQASKVADKAAQILTQIDKSTQIDYQLKFGMSPLELREGLAAVASKMEPDILVTQMAKTSDPKLLMYLENGLR